MAPGNNCLRIVRTKPGPGTGETRYQTEDGRWWKDAEPRIADSTNATEIRYHHGDSLCSHK